MKLAESEFIPRSKLCKFREFDNHEAVIFFADKKTGLEGCVAVHNTNLGPSTGGTRYWRYSTREEAIRDSLRLSRAMTYKCALAGVPFGGGKGIIIKKSGRLKTPVLLREYADFLNLMGGNYSTGEDVGLSEKDIEIMRRRSPHVNGSKQTGPLAPWAALGVYHAARAALEKTFGTSRISGRTFAIKGIGKVGLELCRLIAPEGGDLFVADIDPARIALCRKQFPNASVIPPAKIHTLPVDVYAPCALGGEFHDQNIKQLKCQIICGGANNQLLSDDIGGKIHRRSILYVPDYVANAGGLINAVAALMPGGYDRNWVKRKVEEIARTTSHVIENSARSGMPTSETADMLAKRRFEVRSGPVLPKRTAVIYN